jgi:hypothetical protein
MKFRTAIIIFNLIIITSVYSQTNQKKHRPLGVLPPEACGVWCWYSYGGDPKKWNQNITPEETYPGMKGVPIVVGWNKLEPQEGVYNWDLIDDIIKKAAANNKYVFTLLWLNPVNAEWLYDKGVPKVEIDTFKTDPNFATLPYPMDEKYKYYSERIITKLADHLRSLPPELFERVLFHQVVEGSTGDGFCYKGQPKDPKYNVEREDWAQYQKYIRRFTIKAFSDTTSGKPPMALLIHTEDVAWGLAQYDGVVLKQGVASHFYHSNDSRYKCNIYKPWMTPDNPAGRPIYCRGEGESMWNKEWFVKDPLQNMYFSAIYATHCGLDIWNIPDHVLEDPTWYMALDFFNKYAGKKYPSQSPVAFCALKDELNADDTIRFPEDKFGQANKSNKDRVLKICAEFADHGAIVEDLDLTLAGSLMSRKRTGYNDVAWDRIDDDYNRYLYPINKLQTSVGFWHVGPKDQPYGRFARGFENKTGKNAMYFKFHDDFFEDNNKKKGELEISIIWLDNNKGSWKLSYDAGKNNFKAAKTFTAKATNRWRKDTVKIKDAVMNNNGPMGADIALINADDKDHIFHIIEVTRK